MKTMAAFTANKRRDTKVPPTLGKRSVLNLDPLIARAGIGRGLHDAHVTNAVFEIGMRADAALRFHGGDEIVLDVTAAFQLGRYFHFMQGPISAATGIHGVG